MEAFTDEKSRVSLIPKPKFALSGYSRSLEARNCRPDRRETGTQIGQIGKTKNRIGCQIRKPVSIFRENRKPKRKILKPK